MLQSTSRSQHKVELDAGAMSIGSDGNQAPHQVLLYAEPIWT